MLLRHSSHQRLCQQCALIASCYNVCPVLFLMPKFLSAAGLRLRDDRGSEDQERGGHRRQEEDERRRLQVRSKAPTFSL